MTPTQITNLRKWVSRAVVSNASLDDLRAAIEKAGHSTAGVPDHRLWKFGEELLLAEARKERVA